MSDTELSLGVSDFVALLNQTLEFAYPNVTITGELANFRVSKNRWVYFDLKDEISTVRFFGTIYQLPGPLEDGMLLAVKGVPRLHQQYGFSVNVLQIRPTGEGSIKKAAALLEKKLEAEGLFDNSRKRSLPYPPHSVGLITSAESAAYRDFIKIMQARWGGVDITLIDVQVQGEAAPQQLVAAVEQFNQMPNPPDVLVMTRGGGSADDLQAFSTEQVTRAVSASRIPTLVAIGHEIDTSLAERAADKRASTPSNAAELLVPDRRAVLDGLHAYRMQMERDISQAFGAIRTANAQTIKFAGKHVEHVINTAVEKWSLQRQLLMAFDPQAALRRGYALVRNAQGVLLRSGHQVTEGDKLDIALADSHVTAIIKEVTIEKE